MERWACYTERCYRRYRKRYSKNDKSTEKLTKAATAFGNDGERTRMQKFVESLTSVEMNFGCQWKDLRDTGYQIHNCRKSVGEVWGRTLQTDLPRTYDPGCDAGIKRRRRNGWSTPGHCRGCPVTLGTSRHDRTFAVKQDFEIQRFHYKYIAGIHLCCNSRHSWSFKCTGAPGITIVAHPFIDAGKCGSRLQGTAMFTFSSKNNDAATEGIKKSSEEHRSR